MAIGLGRWVAGLNLTPNLDKLTKEGLTEYIAKHVFERSLYYEKAKHRISINSKSIEAIVAEIRILLH